MNRLSASPSLFSTQNALQVAKVKHLRKKALWNPEDAQGGRELTSMSKCAQVIRNIARDGRDWKIPRKVLRDGW